MTAPRFKNYTRISNGNCRDYVRAREDFQASNIYGITFAAKPECNLSPRYVVFSYGQHWPMFVWQDGVWYENVDKYSKDKYSKDKYSKTTSKHHGQAHPHEKTTPMTVGAMRRIVRDGIAGLALLGELD